MVYRFANGFELSVTGPEADRVLGTFTDSGVRRVLQTGPGADPSAWQSVRFEGVGFLVPEGWGTTDLPASFREVTSSNGTITRSGASNPGWCGWTMFETPHVFLGESTFAHSCPAWREMDLAPGDGIWIRPIEPEDAEALGTPILGGEIDGLQVTVVQVDRMSNRTPSPVLDFIVENGASSVWVSLGVGPDTTTARSILRSFHATTDSTSPETDATDESTVAPVVEPIEGLSEPVELRLLAATVNDPSLAVIDLAAAETTVYPPGSTALGAEPTSGVAITPRGDAAVWVGSSVYVFADADLASEPTVLSPPVIQEAPASGLELYVVPSPDGNRLWIVQPGPCCGAADARTLVDLMDIHAGAVVESIEVPGRAFPIAATSDGVLFNTEDEVDTGAGWVTDEGTQRMLLVRDGGIESLGPGIAVAAWNRFVAFTTLGDGDLVVRDLDIGEDRVVAVDRPGRWQSVGGPIVPGYSQPLTTVSGDGRLIVSRVTESTAEETPERVIYIVSLTEAAASELTREGGHRHLTWSRDDRWLISVSTTGLQLLSTVDKRAPIRLGPVPIEHFVLGAG